MAHGFGYCLLNGVSVNPVSFCEILKKKGCHILECTLKPKPGSMVSEQNPCMTRDRLRVPGVYFHFPELELMVVVQDLCLSAVENRGRQGCTGFLEG